MKKELQKLGLKLGIGAALSACALMVSAPAMAHDRHRDRGDDVALAIGAGVVGLAIGAAIADRDDRYYFDRGFYPARRYVTVRGYPGYYYYYDGFPNRYFRDRYFDRYYAPYYRSRWDRGWDRGWDRRWDRGRNYRYGDRDFRHDRRRYDRSDFRDGRR